MAINHGNHSEPAVSSKMLGFAIFFLIHLFHSSLNKHFMDRPMPGRAAEAGADRDQSPRRSVILLTSLALPLGPHL